MRNVRRHKERNFRTPILGMGVILTTTVCFLLLLYILIILTRFILG